MMDYPDGMIVDARLALIRHAVMTAQVEAGTWRERKVKTVARGFTPAVISAEAREQYQYELLERAGVYMEMGETEQRADALALDDLGCVEFWESSLARQCPAVPYRTRAARPAPSSFCARCESIGHDVGLCPFPDPEARPLLPGAAEVARIAHLRRERRERREAVA